MDEAVLARRVVVMERGRIAMEGPPRAVFLRREELQKLDLDVPVITRLAQLLADDGYAVPRDVLTVEEMVSLLCP